MIQLADHFVQECFTPSLDTKRWTAYLALHSKNHNITYWSMDGYHVDALADYKKDFVWRGVEVFRWSTKEVVAIVKDFHECETHEITNIWTTNTRINK